MAFHGPDISVNVLANDRDPDGDPLKLVKAWKKTDNYPITVSHTSNGYINIGYIYPEIVSNRTVDFFANRQRHSPSGKWVSFFCLDSYPKDAPAADRRNCIMSKLSGFGREEICYIVSDGKGGECEGMLTIYANFKVFSSPLAIDLDGDGEIGRINETTAFDITSDGYTDTLLQWFAPSDGILIRLPQEGESFSGKNLFGDHGGQYDDGFQQLSQRDANSDGQISGAELSGLAIWQDRNSDAMLGRDEVISLDTVGIVSLDTSHKGYVSSAWTDTEERIHFEDVWFPVLVE